MSGTAVLLSIVVAAAAPSQNVPGQVDPAPGDPVAALAQARAAVERAPSEFKPALDLAGALTALGRVDDALAAFAHARELEPTGAGRESGISGEQASAWVVPALLLRDLDRTGEAIGLLEEAVDRRFGIADVYEQLALLHLADGRADRALATVSAAAAEDLGTPGLGLARGLALARDPAHRLEAVGYLQRALDAGVGDAVVVHMEAADVYAAEERYPEALEHLRAAAELAPDEPEVAYRLGRTLAAAGDREAARSALGRYRSLEDARERAADAGRSVSRGRRPPCRRPNASRRRAIWKPHSNVLRA